MLDNCKRQIESNEIAGNGVPALAAHAASRYGHSIGQRWCRSVRMACAAFTLTGASLPVSAAEGVVRVPPVMKHPATDDRDANPASRTGTESRPSVTFRRLLYDPEKRSTTGKTATRSPRKPGGWRYWRT